jgi:signal transduction histidine kinase
MILCCLPNRRTLLRCIQPIAWFFMVLLGVTLTAFAQTEASETSHRLTWNIQFCPAEFNPSTEASAEICNLTTRPANKRWNMATPDQWLRLTVTTPTPDRQLAELSVGPFYLSRIRLFQWQQDQWALMAQSGTEVNPENAQMSLGAHQFPLTLEEGDQTLLIAITAPSVAHMNFSLYSMTDRAATADRQMLIATHLGMLLALVLIAVFGFVLRPTAINFRLAVLMTLILLTVTSGSGYLALYWPQLPASWVGFAFLIFVILRTAVWGWLYQGLIQPYVSHPSYRWGCYITYGLAAVAILLYIFSFEALGRSIGIILILSIPIFHTVAAWRAQHMAVSLKRIVVGSLLAYHALHILALLLVTFFSAQSNMPVTITRVLDLAIPVLAMATVLLRNRATDQLLAQTEQTLKLNQAELAFKSQLHEEKRLLIDMLGHEIKNPLSAIILANQNLALWAEKNALPLTRRLRNMRRATRDIEDVLHRLYLSNRLESEALTPEPTEVNLQGLWQDLIADSVQAQRFDYKAQPEVVITTDAQLAKAVARNLLDNALKYGDPQSLIRIVIIPRDSEHGIQGGFSITNAFLPELKPDPHRLFSRFYQQEGQHSPRGTGLGLNLCRALVDVMNGTIDYALDASEIRMTVLWRD